MYLLSEARSIVSRAIERGLIRYPRGTEFTSDGRPIPKLEDIRYKKTPMEQYACLRAWKMSTEGVPKQTIAASNRCPISKIDQVLLHGKELCEKSKTRSKVSQKRTS